MVARVDIFISASSSSDEVPTPVIVVAGAGSLHMLVAWTFSRNIHSGEGQD